ncbi:MAG: hypothetical protein H0U27_11940 [Nitrosopumilus sp.]|nr:hypothetical protein [Nitrosopumilus sp.]
MKKVKILDKKINSENYTFLDDANIPSQQSSIPHLRDESAGDGETTIKKTDEKYKQKKVMNKHEIAKVSKGLKFLNQSQRNHSSVYE